jgi:hypothetical protein
VPLGRPLFDRVILNSVSNKLGVRVGENKGKVLPVLNYVSTILYRHMREWLY